MQELEQRRNAFELRLFELEQKAQENGRLILADSRQIATDSNRIAADSKQTVSDIKVIAEQMTVAAQASNKFGKRIAWLVVFLAVLQIVVGALALTSDSWIVKVFQKRSTIQQPTEPEANPSR